MGTEPQGPGPPLRKVQWVRGKQLQSQRRRSEEKGRGNKWSEKTSPPLQEWSFLSSLSAICKERQRGAMTREPTAVRDTGTPSFCAISHVTLRSFGETEIARVLASSRALLRPPFSRGQCSPGESPGPLGKRAMVPPGPGLVVYCLLSVHLNFICIMSATSSKCVRESILNNYFRKEKQHIIHRWEVILNYSHTIRKEHVIKEDLGHRKCSW